MGRSRIVGLYTPMQPSETGSPGRSSLLLAGALLMAGFAGLLWIGIASSNPNTYIRAASSWLFFP
jgi:hypothetical protein